MLYKLWKREAHGYSQGSVLLIYFTIQQYRIVFLYLWIEVTFFVCFRNWKDTGHVSSASHRFTRDRCPWSASHRFTRDQCPLSSQCKKKSHSMLIFILTPKIEKKNQCQFFSHVTGVFHWKIYATVFLYFIAGEWQRSVNYICFYTSFYMFYLILAMSRPEYQFSC